MLRFQTDTPRVSQGGMDMNGPLIVTLGVIAGLGILYLIHRFK